MLSCSKARNPLDLNGSDFSALLFSLIIGAAAPDDQPKMFKAIERFRAIVDEPFLDRGTVRRGGLVVILEFAFEREKLLLHIFRAESEALAERRGRRPGRARAPRTRGLRI